VLILSYGVGPHAPCQEVGMWCRAIPTREVVGSRPPYVTGVMHTNHQNSMRFFGGGGLAGWLDHFAVAWTIWTRHDLSYPWLVSHDSPSSLSKLWFGAVGRQ
jgi:hypothetical protein